MSDTHRTIVVLLEDDTRGDDLEDVISAIKQLRNVRHAQVGEPVGFRMRRNSRSINPFLLALAGFVEALPAYVTRYRPDCVLRPPIVKYIAPSFGLITTSVSGSGAAAGAGVQIRLCVRGICGLRPGVPGLSESIEVVSVVDRFLEHSRIFHFRNGGDEEVYLSSADWMSRNLDRRIELLFPIEDPEGRQKVLRALDAAFRDDVKARVLQSDGRYLRVSRRPGEPPFRSQVELHRDARRAAQRARVASGLELEPLASPEG